MIGYVSARRFGCPVLHWFVVGSRRTVCVDIIIVLSFDEVPTSDSNNKTTSWPVPCGGQRQSSSRARCAFVLARLICKRIHAGEFTSDLIPTTKFRNLTWWFRSVSPTTHPRHALHIERLPCRRLSSVVYWDRLRSHPLRRSNVPGLWARPLLSAAPCDQLCLRSCSQSGTIPVPGSISNQV
jgi:hypothetical protein